MQTSTVKTLITAANQYAIVVEHGRILAPGTAFQSANDATLIVGTLAEIQAEAVARNIPWPTPVTPQVVPVPAGLIGKLNDSGAVNMAALSADAQAQIAAVLSGSVTVPASLIAALSAPGVVDLTKLDESTAAAVQRIAAGLGL